MSLLVAVVLPLAVAALLGAVARPVARRLPPATSVRLLVPAALVTAVAGGFGLAVAAFSTVAQDTEVAELGHWSTSALRRLTGIPVPFGVLAGVLVALLLMLSARRLAVGLRQLWSADATCRRLGRDVGGLVIVEDEHPDAYAVQGLRGRVVVSTGMLAALAPAERRVMFAHEASHLAHRHTLLVQLADVAAAANPLLRPVAGVVREGVERWADEDAARQVGDRRLAARALARAALATGAVGGPSRRASVAALGVAGSSAVARATALLEPAPRPRRLLAAALLLATLVAGAGALAAEHITEHDFERAATHSSVVE